MGSATVAYCLLPTGRQAWVSQTSASSSPKQTQAKGMLHWSQQTIQVQVLVDFGAN